MVTWWPRLVREPASPTSTRSAPPTSRESATNSNRRALIAASVCLLRGLGGADRSPRPARCLGLAHRVAPVAPRVVEEDLLPQLVPLVRTLLGDVTEGGRGLEHAQLGKQVRLHAVSVYKRQTLVSARSQLDSCQSSGGPKDTSARICHRAGSEPWVIFSWASTARVSSTQGQPRWASCTRIVDTWCTCS